jgi:hypothetical protein
MKKGLFRLFTLASCLFLVLALLMIGCQAKRFTKVIEETKEDPDREAQIIPQIREETGREPYGDAQQTLNTRCQHSLRDTSLDIIRKKVALSPDPTLEMLTNKSKPNYEEKAAIQKWVWLRSVCSSEQIDLYRRYSAEEHIITMYQAFNDRVLLLIADLYRGSLTYGEFNRRRRKLASESRARFNEIQGMDRIRAEQMAIEARKAAAAEDVTLWQLIEALKQPIPVNKQR